MRRILKKDWYIKELIIFRFFTLGRTDEIHKFINKEIKLKVLTIYYIFIRCHLFFGKF